MTLGLCCHFLGYECARAASITLLAAKDAGMGNEAIPLTIALGSPTSGLVLYLYSKSIKRNGSKTTLRISNICCIFLFMVINYYCNGLKDLFGKIMIVTFYSFREIYVSLLSSQQWAFIASNLNKSTSSYLVAFSGIVSVASAIGGCLVEQLVAYGGVRALLVAALFANLCSFMCNEIAFYEVESNLEQGLNSNPTSPIPNNGETAENNQETPTVNTFGRNNAQKLRYHNQNKEKSHKGVKKTGFWADSWNLIRKNHLLQVLFAEALTHQLCSNMLNLMFHNGLRGEIEDDSARAKLVGRFFATVNITASTLQCFLLPNILSHSSLPSILTITPIIVLIAVVLGVFQPGLIAVMLGFGTIKVLEYSIMHSASEMIYMPMGHEVRYLGKELIRFFGHKLGKSGASLVLSAVVAQVEPSLRVQSVWGVMFTVCWGGVMYYLSRSIEERDRIDHEIEMSQSMENLTNAAFEANRRNDTSHSEEGDDDLRDGVMGRTVPLNDLTSSESVSPAGSLYSASTSFDSLNQESPPTDISPDSEHFQGTMNHSYSHDNIGLTLEDENNADNIINGNNGDSSRTQSQESFHSTLSNPAATEDEKGDTLTPIVASQHRHKHRHHSKEGKPHFQAPPVMMRVGSTQVSLNTLQEHRRRLRRPSNDSFN